MTTRRAGPSITVGGIEIVPIEDTTLHDAGGPRRVFVLASKAPSAVVVRAAAGDYALDLEGRRTSLDDLLRDVPGLRERLNG